MVLFKKLDDSCGVSGKLTVLKIQLLWFGSQDRLTLCIYSASFLFFFFKKVSFALIVQEYKGELEKQLGLSWPLDLHSDEKLVMVYEEEQVLHCLEN